MGLDDLLDQIKDNLHPCVSTDSLDDLDLYMDSIRMTLESRIKTKYYSIHAAQVKPGDMMRTPYGSYVEVISVTPNEFGGLTLVDTEESYHYYKSFDGVVVRTLSIE